MGPSFISSSADWSAAAIVTCLFSVHKSAEVTGRCRVHSALDVSGKDLSTSLTSGPSQRCFDRAERIKPVLHKFTEIVRVGRFRNCLYQTRMYPFQSFFDRA